MSSDNTSQEFARLLTDVQRSLYAYILSLIPSTDAAKDILQQTNLVLLQKQGEYDATKNFGGWAAKIAYYEVLAARKQQQRDRLYFNDQLLQSLADEGESDLTCEDPQLRALAECFEKLTDDDRRMIQQRYHDGRSASDISKEAGRTAHAISQALYRIRVSLLQCIQRRLSASEGER